MTFEQMAAFNVVLLVAIASPGPALLFAIRTTLSAGRRAGISTGLGLGLMAATWTLMALLGLDAVFRLFPWAYMAAKTAGAAYLLYIAFQMWRGARADVSENTRLVQHSFRQGFMINLLNPKSVLFAGAVLVVVFPAEISLAEKTLVALNHLIVEFSFYTALAFWMSTQAVRRRYLRAKVYIDRAASVILGALGLRLLVDR